jgi:anhydro-N-acetylmuramic acid kinase
MKNTDLKQKTFKSIGLMSGTSLDGLDICLTEFDVNNHQNFKILKAETIKYNQIWEDRLGKAYQLSGFELMQLNRDFGIFCAEKILDFIQDQHFEVNCVASHGHTVFHQPKLGFTTQIGCGATIYAKTGIRTVCDFRSVDVAFGGQGAPLVPIGDELLFKNYQACLNLGGISNISNKTENGILAQDLGYCNLLLNDLSKRFFNKNYDQNGNFGRNGNFNQSLLDKMLTFTKERDGKSLAREDFEQFKSLIDNLDNQNDIINTSYHYITNYLSEYLNKNNISEVLVTGGGAHNKFLIELLKSKTESKIIVPDIEIIDFKEALIFSYLGLLRIENQVNALKSVTKALKDSIGGAIYG